MLRKIIRIAIPLSRLPLLAALRSSRPHEGTCTENYHINVSSDVNFLINVEENDSDSQEDENLSSLENEIINEDNLSNVDSTVGPDNDKTFDILGQEEKDFRYLPDYILDWYKNLCYTMLCSTNLDISRFN